MTDDFKRPRLAYICADIGIPVFGNKGCSIHVQEILRGFQRLGFSIDLFAVRLGGACPIDLQEVRVHSFPVSRSAGSREREIEAMNASETILAAMRREARFDLVYERYSLWSSVGSQYRNESSIPCIYEVNAPLIEEQRRHRDLIDSFSAQTIERCVFHQSDALIAVSEGVAKYIKSKGADERKTHVIGNGVDVDRFLPAQSSASTEGINIGFTGTLRPWHGVEILFEAFQQFHKLSPKSKLLVIGDGPLRQGLEEKFCDRNSSLQDSIVWFGSVDSSSVPALIQQMDVAVAPYPDLAEFYFSPLKVFEYMSCGLPVVASRIGQLNEIIDHGFNGILVDPGCSQALLQAFCDLEKSPGVRQKLGASARAKALESFSWKNVLHRTLETVEFSDVRESTDCLDRVGGGL